MRKRPFGKTGVSVSEIGLGCWQLGGADWGSISEQSALDILNSAADTGVTFFDAADVYGSGRSESVIGKFLKQRSGDFFVATKLGRSEDLYPDKYTEAGVRAATEASLQRLGVETLDLTQLHCIPLAELKKGEVFEWLRKLQQEGKIRNFGASVETSEEALVCLEQPGLASLQIIFNIFRQSPIMELFPAVREKGVAIVVRLPLASGLLTGKFTKDTTFGEKDHRNFNRDGQFFNVGETFAGLPFDKGVELAEEMKAFVPESLTMVQMAQRWILDHDEVSVVIPGASTPEQAQGNASVSALPELPAQLHSRLAFYYRTQVAPHIRGEY
jgi:aryl-alcohol dehydrogenase-like predicted oxidoreductase